MATTKNENKAPIVVELNLDGISDSLKSEIIELFTKTRFNKISVPLYSYRRLFDEEFAKSTESNNDKTTVVGFIKKFDSKSNKFTLAIYNGLRDRVDAFKNPVVKVVFTEYDGTLGTVTKIIIEENA